MICQKMERIKINPMDYAHLKDIYKEGGFTEHLPMNGNGESHLEVDILSHSMTHYR